MWGESVTIDGTRCRVQVEALYPCRWRWLACGLDATYRGDGDVWQRWCGPGEWGDVVPAVQARDGGQLALL